MRVCSVVVFLFLSFCAFADDEVKLKNGDRVTGKITSLAGGKLVVETSYAGKVTIDWAQVVSIKSDNQIKVKLTTGDTLDGKLSPGPEGRFKVESPGVPAPVEVEYAKVTYFNEPPTQWHGSINLAAKASDGNTLTKSVLASAEATRETESDLLLLRTMYRYGQQNGLMSERSVYGIVKAQYKFTPRFYGFVSEELLSDTFKDFALQSVTAVGVGYDIVKESWVDLSAEAGLAYVVDDYAVAVDESHFGGRVAARGRLALPLGFEAKDMFVIYPNFKYGPNFQLRNEFTLGTALGGGWNLLGGIITEYNNRPSPGLNTTDDTYFLGLGYTF